MTDQEILEEEAELALAILRDKNSYAVAIHDGQKKRLDTALQSLKEKFPSSYILQPGFNLSY